MTTKIDLTEEDIKKAIAFWLNDKGFSFETINIKLIYHARPAGDYWDYSYFSADAIFKE